MGEVAQNWMGDYRFSIFIENVIAAVVVVVGALSLLLMGDDGGVGDSASLIALKIEINLSVNSV